MVTEFQKKVYSLCRKIPKGKVSTYGEIGKKLGRGQVYRAVGVALNKNPFAPKVPCHRVVCSDGSIGGFASGVRKKISLLKKENVQVKNNNIVDFKKKLFRF
jgi:methylated-DNA-[protein]-cysteine S-methyltransferase